MRQKDTKNSCEANNILANIGFAASGYLCRKRYWNMKKAVKWLAILLSAVAALLAILCGVVYLLVFSNRATTPDEIARKAGLRLPAYRITATDDNMDRMASAWSYYCYEVEFDEPLSESFLKKVTRKKTFLRDGDLYMLEDGVADSWTCCVRIFPSENRAVLEYTFWDFLF